MKRKSDKIELESDAWERFQSGLRKIGTAKPVHGKSGKPPVKARKIETPAIVITASGKGFEKPPH